jgi:hypothetical protein
VPFHWQRCKHSSWCGSVSCRGHGVPVLEILSVRDSCSGRNSSDQRWARRIFRILLLVKAIPYTFTSYHFIWTQFLGALLRGQLIVDLYLKGVWPTINGLIFELYFNPRQHLNLYKKWEFQSQENPVKPPQSRERNPGSMQYIHWKTYSGLAHSLRNRLLRQ